MGNNILIVDDELVARESLKKLLSPYGKCDVAVNGEKALEAFKKAQDKSDPYTLITLDIDMPDTNGLEVLKIIRVLESMATFPRKNRAKIIMISATEDVENNTVQSYLLDSEYYMVKPATPQKIADCAEILGFKPAEYQETNN